MTDATGLKEEIKIKWKFQMNNKTALSPVSTEAAGYSEGLVISMC